MMIRKASNADAPEIKGLVFSVLQSYGLQPDPSHTDADLDDIERCYFQARGWFAVLVDGADIIGSYGLCLVDDATCELRKMYLNPQYRGKGYGKQLLEDALAKAAELGYKTVTLETASVLREAIALYLKYGFEPYAATHLSPRCDQAYMKRLE